MPCMPNASVHTASSTSARRRLRALALAAGAAWGVTSLSASALGQYIWVGPLSSNFNTGTNWQGGVAPPSNNPATTLTFTSGNVGAAITATNNIGTPFQVNALNFNLNGNPAFTINGTAGNTFQLTGPAPSINLYGNNIANAVTSATGATMQLAANTTITGSSTAMGGITFNGAISETGGPRSILVTGATPTQNSRVVNFGVNSTFTGGLTVDNGAVVGWSGFAASALGAAGSTFRVGAGGGVLQNLANNGIVAANMQIDGPLTVLAPSVGFSIANGLSGSGPLTLNAGTSNAIAINANAAGYTGSVTLDRYTLPNFTSSAGSMLLSTGTGTLTGVGTFNVRAGHTLTLNNAASGAGVNADRVNNATVLNLASGALALSSTGTSTTTQVNVTEVVGTVSAAGFSTVTLTSSGGATRSVTMNVNTALNRIERGTLLIRGNLLGSGTLTANSTLNGDGSQNFDGAANTGYLVVPASLGAALVGGGGASGSQTISILPHAVGDASATGLGSSLVTLDAIAGSTSLNARPLAAAEYATDLVSGATTNARLTAASANAGAIAVNALVLASSGASDGAVTGAGTLSVTSGVILAAQTNAMATIANTVNFGAAEGHVYTPGTGGLTISGSLVGSGGLTKSGGGTSNSNTLFLTGDNTGLTGPLTINAGTVNFNSAGALPGTGTIITNGTGVAVVGSAVGLSYSGTNALSITRAITANAGWTSIRALDAGTGGSLTLAGQITGSGGVNLQSVAGGADVWVTGTSNTYTGPSRIFGGNVHIAGDGSLGNGGGVDFAGGSLVLEGDWTSSRHINFSSSTSVIDTNGRDGALNGPMTSFQSNSLANTAAGGFTKRGSGTLALNSMSNTVTGAITVSGGTLLVNGSLGASTANAVTVNTGATLGGIGSIYRNISVAAGGNLAPGASPGVLTAYGNVTLAAGASALFELAGATPGNGPGNHDQLVVNGAVALSDALLSAVMNYHASTSDVFWLVINDGTDAVTGTFAGLPENATVNLGMYGSELFTAQISYTGNFTSGMVDGSGNDIVLYNVVPAPGAASLLALAGLATGRRRRTQA